MLYSFVIGLVHPKLYPAIKKRHHQEDKLLNDKFSELSKHNINPFHFGAQKEFENFKINSHISSQLLSIEAKITPLEKLNCLRKTLDLISKQMSETIERTASPLEGKSEPLCIMSDDLISTVICVLASGLAKSISSDINFIQSFSWHLPRNNEYGYSLVTFEVAKEFIKNYNISDLKSDNAPNAKELNAGINESTSSGLSHIYSTTVSPLDRELEKIAKLMNATKLGYESFASESIKEMQDSIEYKRQDDDLG